MKPIERLLKTKKGRFLLLAAIFLSATSVIFFTSVARTRTRTTPKAQVTANCVANFEITKPICVASFDIVQPASLTCQNLKLYKVDGLATNPSSWHLLTTTEIQALLPGQTIHISTTGSITGGATIDKARIRVNSATWTLAHETTNKKPKTNTADPDEFYIPYTIPTGTTSFIAESELHDATSNKWY